MAKYLTSGCGLHQQRASNYCSVDNPSFHQAPICLQPPHPKMNSDSSKEPKLLVGEKGKITSQGPIFTILAKTSSPNGDLSTACFMQELLGTKCRQSHHLKGEQPLLVKTDLLNVAVELLLAAAGPVVAMEGRLDQWCHDAPHAGLISTAIALAIMLHA